jgi:hypothetical protein
MSVKLTMVIKTTGNNTINKVMNTIAIKLSLIFNLVGDIDVENMLNPLTDR